MIIIMKIIITTFILFTTLIYSGVLSAFNSKQEVQKEFNLKDINVDKDSIADSSCFSRYTENMVAQMFKLESFVYIDSLYDSIEVSKMPNTEKAYWLSYINYSKGIYFKSKKNDNVNSERFNTFALEMLKENLDSSENYALYAASISYSIQFANMMQLSTISKSVVTNANKALELNSKNVRAYYVLASHNFYTPKMFGGMTKVEEYGIKGLSCPSSTNSSACLNPQWGKPKLYQLLMKYYKQENQNAKSEQIKALAKQEFPNLF